MAFNYTKKQSDFTNQALTELTPLYEMAIKQLQDSARQQKYTSNDMAAARGFGQSGLAVDQLNKIDSATNSAIAQQNAQKLSEANQMGYNRFIDDRSFEYGKFADDRTQSNWQKEYDYQTARDKVSDNQWSQEFALRKKVGSSSSSGSRSSSSNGSTATSKATSSLANAYNQYQSSRTASQPIDNYYKKQEELFGTKAPYAQNSYTNSFIKSPVDNPNLSAWDKIQILKGGGYR